MRRLTLTAMHSPPLRNGETIVNMHLKQSWPSIRWKHGWLPLYGLREHTLEKFSVR